MKVILAFVPAAAALLLCACGASKPSDKQAREIVEQSFADIQKLGAGPLTDFTKANGEALERSGQKIYIYHYLAATTLPEGIAWVKGGLLGLGQHKFVRDDGRGLYVQKEDLPAGTTAVRRGQIEFRQTEQGWVSEGGPQRVDTGYCIDLKPDACYKQLGYDKLE
ncbi:hypothetical protein SAMN04488038_106103 [Solimonas aquatica]|uniref:Lipoprotein n=1 Tax=Solimonas aquatica TaxID=489703 RepID=A0A1H9FUC1_9GAMM|nr:hypothetical protein [Solimonas aquatica]SEQ41494.1 hypothetical protein SAMN04488038_106103 [Solimonas aquatica]